jgi:hypothetical protein
MSAKSLLSPEVLQKILASIRAGGYAHVAAQAWGVPLLRWRRWLAAGRRPSSPEPYRSLFRAVAEARAQARLKAEIDALAKDPRFWLKTGPGKDADDAPGWGPARARRADATEAGPALDPAALKKFMDAFRLKLAESPQLLAVFDQLSTELWPAVLGNTPD